MADLTERDAAQDEFRRPSTYTVGFEQHASLDAIQAYTRAARKKQSELQNELGWLEELGLQRLAQMEAGLWP